VPVRVLHRRYRRLRAHPQPRAGVRRRHRPARQVTGEGAVNEHVPAVRPDTVTAAAYDPAPLEPYAPAPAAVELAAERGPVVWVPDAYGRMVPMPKHLAPPPMVRPEPRDLTPLPLLDPVAQRFIGAGIGGGALAAGVGW